jgi:hypothetical protein
MPILIGSTVLGATSGKCVVSRHPISRYRLNTVFRRAEDRRLSSDGDAYPLTTSNVHESYSLPVFPLLPIPELMALLKKALIESQINNGCKDEEFDFAFDLSWNGCSVDRTG